MSKWKFNATGIYEQFSLILGFLQKSNLLTLQRNKESRDIKDLWEFVSKWNFNATGIYDQFSLILGFLQKSNLLTQQRNKELCSIKDL